MIDIVEYKKQALERKQNLIKRTEGKKFEKDTRFWELTIDPKTKVGKAIIRPIGPAPEDESEYVMEYGHFIWKGNRAFSTKCPSTVAGRKCPICEKFFESDKEDKALRRNAKVIMNILVVDDPANPANNGKVFLYRAPLTILNKIKDKLNPEFDSDESINVFDMWEGANIRLVTRDKGGFINYENTTIESPSPIFDDVNNVALYESLFKKMYLLKEFAEAPTYDEVKEKYESFMKSNSNLAEMQKISNADKKTQEEVLNLDMREEVEPETEKTVKTVSEDDFFADLSI